jgi:BolA protein
MSLEPIIRARLAALKPLSLTIHDESHNHIGHVGATGGAGHYWLSIVSAQFNQQPTLTRHRMVYNLLADLIPGRIHALSIHALGSDEEL